MSSCPCGSESFGYHACYGHLKARHLNGIGLDPPELGFVGFDPAPRPRDGWQSPDEIPSLEAFHDPETGDLWLSDEEARLLQMLADPPSPGASA